MPLSGHAGLPLCTEQTLTNRVTVSGVRTAWCLHAQSLSEGPPLDSHPAVLRIPHA